MTAINWEPSASTPHILGDSGYFIVVHSSADYQVCRGVTRFGRPVVLGKASSVEEVKALAERHAQEKAR